MEDCSSAEQRAAETEKKLCDLTSQINAMIQTRTDELQMSYSTEQTLNAVSLLAQFYVIADIRW